MGIENYHITLKIELDLEQLGFDEEDAKETAKGHIDDYLNEYSERITTYLTGTLRQK